MDRELWPSGLRVLVIDNNSSYLSVMEELLIKCSYKGNSLEILYLLKKHSSIYVYNIMMDKALLPLTHFIIIVLKPNCM